MDLLFILDLTEPIDKLIAKRITYSAYEQGVISEDILLQYLEVLYKSHTPSFFHGEYFSEIRTIHQTTVNTFEVYSADFLQK